MEITLDIAAIRKVLKEEYAVARAEIRELGPVRAYQRSQVRHDERLTTAPDATSVACRSGCHWCCYFSVDVRPVEVFRILEVMEQQFTREEQSRLQHEIAANATMLRQLDEIERMRHNVKCPFLAEGRCIIYAARPQTCRNYHATDAAGCRQSFEDPGNLDIDPEFAPLVYQAGAAHVDAFSQALRDEGYSISALELNGALAAALAEGSGARRRFLAREAPFADADEDDAPFELLEEEDARKLRDGEPL